jgi:endogenous inhibitor of DNA gyrase (YacG/DUF329 family)
MERNGHFRPFVLQNCHEMVLMKWIDGVHMTRNGFEMENKCKMDEKCIRNGNKMEN